MPSANASASDIEGYCRKLPTQRNLLTDLVPHEQRRYLQLDTDGMLRWFANEQHAARGEAKGSMSVNGATITRTTTTTFTILADATASGSHEHGSRLPLRLDTVDECNRWLAKLRKWARKVEQPSELPSSIPRWSGLLLLPVRNTSNGSSTGSSEATDKLSPLGTVGEGDEMPLAKAASLRKSKVGESPPTPLHLLHTKLFSSKSSRLDESSLCTVDADAGAGNSPWNSLSRSSAALQAKVEDAFRRIVHWPEPAADAKPSPENSSFKLQQAAEREAQRAWREAERREQKAREEEMRRAHMIREEEWRQALVDKTRAWLLAEKDKGTSLRHRSGSAPPAPSWTKEQRAAQKAALPLSPRKQSSR